MGEEIAYIGMGTNAGDRLGNLVKARRKLESHPDLDLEKVSSVYETEPIGMEGGHDFLNAVCCLRTALDPRSLLSLLEQVELDMGRRCKGESKSRVIDLDLLLHGRSTVEENGLRVPHPRLHERRFVLVPLCEIAPETLHPVLGKTICDILLDLGEGDGVRFYSDFPKWEPGQT